MRFKTVFEYLLPKHANNDYRGLKVISRPFQRTTV